MGMMLNKKVLVLFGVFMIVQVCVQVSEDEVLVDCVVDYMVVVDDEFECQLREFDEFIEDFNVLFDVVDKSFVRDRDGM